MKTIRVFLVDDEPTVRFGLRMRLEMEPDVRIAGEAGDGASAIEAIRRERPDVVLMDIELGDTDGISVTQALAQIGSVPAVIIVSMRDDASTVARALDAGAVAFVGKHEIDARLLQAIREAASRAAPVARLHRRAGEWEERL